MKLVIISDTHGEDFTKDLPDGDMLIHCGDMTDTGNVNQLAYFNDLCGQVLHKYTHGIHITPGNHDLLFETQPSLCEGILTNCNIYINEPLELEGLKFWFSPWTPMFCNWAFMGYPDEMIEVWDKIPLDTNILITHGPAFGMLDGILQFDKSIRHAGCRELLFKLKQLPNLLLHASGHIHCGSGVMYKNDVYFANAAMCDDKHTIVNKPKVFVINSPTEIYHQPLH